MKILVQYLKPYKWLVVIVLLLYAATGSWMRVGIVMLALPFSMVGAVWLLWALGYHLSLAVVIGMIALAGIIVRNSILLVDFIELQVARGMAFKQAVVQAKEGDTHLSLKKVVPVRLLKNDFYKIVHEAEQRGATPEELIQVLGRGRAKKGMFEGDLEQGELEIGQVSAMLHEILPAARIVDMIWTGFNEALASPLG